MSPLPTRDGWATSAEPGDDVSAFARRSGLELLRFAHLLRGDRYSDQGAESEPTSTMLLGSATLPGVHC
jgi:hypothetical protein